MGFKNNYNNHSDQSNIHKSIENFPLSHRSDYNLHTFPIIPFSDHSLHSTQPDLHCRVRYLHNTLVEVARTRSAADWGHNTPVPLPDFSHLWSALNETFIIKNGFTIRHHHPPGDASQGHSHHYSLLLFADDGPWPGWNPIAPIGALPGGC